jgi:hypothetical protein
MRFDSVFDAEATICGKEKIRIRKNVFHKMKDPVTYSTQWYIETS